MIEKIIEHYKNPRNKGIIEDADVIIKEAIPSCGDLIILYAKFSGDKVSDVKFEGYGCITSIAIADIISEEIKHRNIDEIKKIDEKYIVNILGNRLPKDKEHSIVLVFNALRKLIEKYERNIAKNSKV